MAASMKLLLRPRSRQLLGQAKLAFLSVSQHRNVSSHPTAQWMQEVIGFRKAEGFRSFSSAGDASETHNQVNEAGSTESPLMKSMANKIKDQLTAESIIVKDAYGDGKHVSIYVVSSAFEGQSAVNRQRMVYKAIWEDLQTTVHAVDYMVTRTPAEPGLVKS